jgi:hypothetical protein
LPATRYPPVIPPLPAAQANLDFVLLMRCRTLFEADLITSRLDAAGFQPFIPDEFLMQVICWNLNAYGYVRVQVPPNNYTDARELLETTGHPLSCGSGEN